LKDQKEGYGELYIAQSDELYKGNFKNNLQDGLGTIKYSNGSKFEGTFKYGLKNGLGSIYDAKDQLTFKANWVND
jgi:radial spoke head protein 1